MRGVVVCFPHRSAHHVSAAAPTQYNTEKQQQLEDYSAQIKGGWDGGGFMDLKRVYLICDQPDYIKEPAGPIESQTRSLTKLSKMWSITAFPFSWESRDDVETMK